MIRKDYLNDSSPNRQTPMYPFKDPFGETVKKYTRKWEFDHVPDRILEFIHANQDHINLHAQFRLQCGLKLHRRCTKGVQPLEQFLYTQNDVRK